VTFHTRSTIPEEAAKEGLLAVVIGRVVAAARAAASVVDHWAESTRGVVTALGWGVVAVDPSVIPLGTRMTIPGYGEGVAADTGSAVRGRMIDLWFPTTAQALAWGRRTVTITLH